MFRKKILLVLVLLLVATSLVMAEDVFRSRADAAEYYKNTEVEDLKFRYGYDQAVVYERGRSEVSVLLQKTENLRDRGELELWHFRYDLRKENWRKIGGYKCYAAASSNGILTTYRDFKEYGEPVDGEIISNNVLEVTHKDDNGKLITKTYKYGFKIADDNYFIEQ